MRKSTFSIALQLDESTDVIRISQVLVYVRYVQKEKTKFELKEEFLFCESLQTIATATDVVNLIKNFLKSKTFLLKKLGMGVLTVHRLCLAVNRCSWHC